MRNIWRLFAGDVKRLGRNVITVITVLGLVALPSLFSWYNILACWDVFDNTGNLTVAVANADDGYTSDLVPIEMNVGEQVVSALRANDQLDWTFTDEADAIDGVEAGRYYAAVVIPPSFSRDMMSFYSDDVEHAQITYYTNEKKNAIAPKVTDQGADQVAAQVNQVFVETLSEIALDISTALVDYADSSDVGGRIEELGDHVARLGSQASDAAGALGLYATVLSSARSLVDDSAALMEQVRTSSEDAAHTASAATDAADGIAAAMDESLAALSDAIGRSAEGYEAVGASIGAALDTTDALAADSAAQLRGRAAAVDAVASKYLALTSELREAQAVLPEHPAEAIEALADRLDSAAALQAQLRDALYEAADEVESANGLSHEKRDEAKRLSELAAESLADAQADYDGNLRPVLEALADTVSTASDGLGETVATFRAAEDDLSQAAGSVSEKLGSSQDKLSKAADALTRSSERLGSLGSDIARAAASGNTQALRDVIGSDPATLASALAAPIELERHAIYPVENFGSAMAPLYTTLALWIGALLIMVMLKIAPSGRTLGELDHATPRQVFCGRFGIVAVISVLQSTSVSLGNLLFLEVQTADPLLYLVSFWVSGLVFAFIIYTLVALFANFGKALSVVLLIVQVSGGGGSFPMQLLPQFFQDVSPYLPITHAVWAMRAAMFGVYAGDFWIEIGTLALFAVPFAILGLALQGPFSKVVPKFVARVERSKLM